MQGRLATTLLHTTVAFPLSALAEGLREAGTHRFGFGGRSLPSGVYLLRAETPGEVLTRRITLLR